MTWLTVGFAAIALRHDLRTREIPDGLSLGLLGAALAAMLFGLTAVTTLDAALGASTALLVTLPFFAADVLGGGDVKLLSAIGFALGGRLTLSVLVWTGLFGGLFGLIALGRGRRDLAFVPAIAAAVTIVAVLNAGGSNVLLGR